jgi:hypothetical protein
MSIIKKVLDTKRLYECQKLFETPETKSQH